MDGGPPSLMVELSLTVFGSKTVMSADPAASTVLRGWPAQVFSAFLSASMSFSLRSVSITSPPKGSTATPNSDKAAPSHIRISADVSLSRAAANSSSFGSSKAMSAVHPNRAPNERPTAALVGGLRSSNLTGLLQGFAGGDQGGAAGELAAESMDDLVAEYTALFLGPGPHLSPHESVHRSGGPARGLLWGDATVEVKAFMEGAGLALPAETHLIPDHIAVEFQFLARLAEAECTSWGAGDRAQARYRLEWQDRFVQEHVAAWVPEFAQRVCEAARTYFWKAIARGTGDFVREMAAALPDLAREAEALAEVENSED